MDINRDVELDTSQVEDLGRGGGGGLGGRVALGGGGVSIVGLLIYFLMSQLGGGALPQGLPQGLPQSGGFGQLPAGEQVDGEALKQKCRTGSDAQNDRQCEAVAVLNSLQAYWSAETANSRVKFVPPKTGFFQDSVNTACGAASSGTGPFYCPADRKIYIDLSFYEELEQRFGAQDSLFPRAYVLAHEYGHHMQNLIGTNEVADRLGASGPTSGSVRLELQADCYAGVWANHASRTASASGKPFFTDITQEDVAAGVDTAGRIGDDFIQSKIGGQAVDKSQFTHGSSAQREKWLATGIRTGDPKQCDTFSKGVSLG